MKKQVNINNRGSLMAVDGTCLGYIINFFDHGIYEPNLGKIDITKEEADIHNKLLDEAIIKGLNNCQVGQVGVFYLNKQDGVVKTWLGTIVSGDVVINGRSVTFVRNGKKFRGRIGLNVDNVNFKRIS